MTQNQNQHSCRIARVADKQGARPAIPSQVAVVKLTTEKINKLLKTNQILTIGTMNVQTLQKQGQIYELITSAMTTKQDIICIQEHRYIHDDIPIREQRFENWILLICSLWRNSINASNGGIGMLVNQCTYNTISSVEMITPRIMVTSFQGNPQTTVISCYSPTMVSNETDAQRFYSDLSSLIRQVPKHNILIIGGDFNAHLGQNDSFKLSYHQNSNRNGEMFKNLLLENKLLCLNTHFQKRQGQTWTY